MGELIGLDGRRMSSKGAELETPDIAAMWQHVSCKVAIENGVLQLPEGEQPPSFYDLHPVMQSIMCESFQQMIDLGFIRPGYESAIKEIVEAAGIDTSEDATDATETTVQ